MDAGAEVSLHEGFPNESAHKQVAHKRVAHKKEPRCRAIKTRSPPSSLSPGDVGFSFNNEAFPGSAQAGSQFAIPSYAGQPDTGTAVRWQTIFGTAPTAVSLILQGAMADVDTEYQTIDTTSNTAGEARTVTGVQCKIFCASSSARRLAAAALRQNSWSKEFVYKVSPYKFAICVDS